ncbi:DUF4913 domain-containing protein [Nocardia ignorata]|uniref:Uncharacterized protein DUF4913 n=1 Tax=Nocardia ignorata TaxID=145285 RepID=A0A4V3CQ98_NOCIG|nr:DUF4913 domain-containing protein [Nocardia ignorata]TDP41389.1 uncharacterized protein DUF4913 [Nocardia ignorata]
MNDQESNPETQDYAYADLVSFVNEYLSEIYRRQVTDISDTVWCPEWWRHPEAAVRLLALWQAWEYYRQKGGTGLSVWFLDHADPHMTKLFDPRGPFKYCSVRNGHKEMLKSLPVENPTDDQQFAHVPRSAWEKGDPFAS